MKKPILTMLIGYIIGIIWELYLKTSIVPFIIILLIILIAINLQKVKRKAKQLHTKQ